jgi:hypothetical protein
MSNASREAAVPATSEEELTTLGLARLNSKKMRTVLYIIMTNYIMRVKCLFLMTSACIFHEFHKCCGSGMFSPDQASKFFHAGFWIQSQKDSESRIQIRIKEFKYLSG